MAPTTKERTELRGELVGRGYSWEYIDEWQPKITLYRHAIKMSSSGIVISPAGTAVKGLPGNPDYVARKAKLGMLPYLPSDTCECRWCVGRMVGNAKADPVEETPGAESNPAVEIKCAVCDYKASGGSKVSAMSRLKAHAETH